MATKVSLPRLGLTTVEGTVAKWLKHEGEAVSKDEALVEVLVDKVNFIMGAPETGVLLKITAPTGTVVPVGNAICWIGHPGEVMVPDVSTASKAPPEKHAPITGTGRYVPATPAAKRLAHQHGLDLARVAGSGSEAIVLEEDVLQFLAIEPQQGEADGEFIASPLAKSLARDLRFDLATIRGTGYGGRITRDDVLAAADRANAAPQLQSTGSTPAAAAPALPPAAVASTVPLVGLRRTIAQRMALSSQTVARVTHTTEVDMTEVAAMREAMKIKSEAAHGVRITFTDIIVKVVAQALHDHPLMNSRLAGEEIQVIEQINVGVAVSISQGLIVPVVHDANRKDLISVSREIREKVDRARANAVKPEDVMGGTFTVTNLGAYEIDAFTPIVNLPEVGILGVGRIVEKPVILQGEFARRSMMFLSLSFDHRVIDELAAEFLRSVKHFLEDPNTLFGRDDSIGQ